MSKPNKYYQHVSRKPTGGDPLSRAYKRRKLHESWKNYYAIEKNMNNFGRRFRRLAWKASWALFKDNKREAKVVNE